MTVANRLYPLIRKHLTEIAQILQVYCRLAELELAAGGRPKFSEPGEYGLPEGTAEKARGWAEGEAEKARIMKSIAAFNRYPRAALEAMR